MDLARLQKNWTNLGRNNPLWAILGSEQSADVPWDVDAFFRTGAGFCDYLSRHFRSLGVEVPRQHALDFGCGYGRISQGLAQWFDRVVGVDIAAPMIEGARRLDRSGGRCSFVLNERADLGQFEDRSFDFAVAVLVLQHMRSDYAMNYVREFLRVLRPDGLAFFQVASVPVADFRSAPGGATEVIARLPLGDLRGAIVAHPAFVTLQPAGWLWYSIDLHNHGERRWCGGPGPHRVQVATRWYVDDGVPGEPAVLHDLGGDVAPGGHLRMAVPVRAPGEPMRAVLVFQVVVGGAWIELTDLASARVNAMIEPCDPELMRRNAAGGPPVLELPGATPGSGSDDEAVIEIHGTPVPRVVDVVREAGGAVLDVAEDVWAGPLWLSAHYTVRKL